jgi:preprotein translocase subunit SecB
VPDLGHPPPDPQKGSAFLSENALEAVPHEPQLVPNFAYQLVDVYLTDSRIERRTAEPDDPLQPTFETGLASEDGPKDGPEGAFVAHLHVVVKFRFRDEAVITVAATTTGFFTREGSLESDLAERFKTIDCAVLLWPYARANIGELGRMTNVGLPPLPTVDVRELLSDQANST